MKYDIGITYKFYGEIDDRSYNSIEDWYNDIVNLEIDTNIDNNGIYTISAKYVINDFIDNYKLYGKVSDVKCMNSRYGDVGFELEDFSGQIWDQSITFDSDLSLEELTRIFNEANDATIYTDHTDNLNDEDVAHEYSFSLRILVDPEALYIVDED